MFVSEIDPFNYRMSVKNVEQNELQDQIHSTNRFFCIILRRNLISFLVMQMDSSALFNGLIDRANHYDFLMCNPPFFTDALESQGITNKRKSDRPSANSINTAADIESIYDQGGEVEFVKRMIDESRTYATNVR
jgi:23S rRNA A1618 N6-methylase RlmF